MNLEMIRECCLKKKGAEETFPFDDITPVYKVMNKMFLLASVVPPYSINVKADPENIIDMRERYEAVTPGYHMSKAHWNSVALDNTIEDKLIFQWIDDSYNLVVKGLKKSDKEELNKLEN
jgi:predicted DNA-binding protein (MmcQ/YjbR family)